MKLLKKGAESNVNHKPKNHTRLHDERTNIVRTLLPGCFQENSSQVPSRQDLMVAVEFGEAMLESAILLSERLVKLENTPSTQLLREKLNSARSNFKVLQARASAYPGQRVK